MIFGYLFGIELPFDDPKKIKFADLLKLIYDKQGVSFPGHYQNFTYVRVGTTVALTGIHPELALSMFFYKRPYYFISINGTYDKSYRGAVKSFEIPDVNPQTTAKIKDILKGLGFIKQCDKELQLTVLVRG